jgi:hypothetical protein
MRPTVPAKTSTETFLREVENLPAARGGAGRGRLLFAMDATASREPTWDHACGIQGEMFVAADALGGLDVRWPFTAASTSSRSVAGRPKVANSLA